MIVARNPAKPFDRRVEDSENQHNLKRVKHSPFKRRETHFFETQRDEILNGRNDEMPYCPLIGKYPPMRIFPLLHNYGILFRISLMNLSILICRSILNWFTLV